MASTVVFCGYPGARLASVYCRWRACFCLPSVDGMDGRVPGVVEAVRGEWREFRGVLGVPWCAAFGTVSIVCAKNDSAPAGTTLEEQ